MGSNGLHSPLMEMSENGARRRANHPAPARSRTAGSLEFHNFHGGLAPAFRHRANTKVYGGADQVTTALLPDVPRGKECPDHAILMGLPEIKGISLYRSVMIEFVATMLLFVMHIAIVRAALTTAPDASGNQVPIYPNPNFQVALGHAILVPLFIFAAGPGSGGHIVSTVTLATAFTGHTSWFRALFYFIAQQAGAVVGALLVRAAAGWDDNGYAELAGCGLGDMTPNGAVLSEFCFTFVMFFIAYGVAFDPKAADVYGPIVAPILIGITLATILFASAAMSPTPGYTIGLTWNFCMAPAIATGHIPHFVWIYFVGPSCACAANALLFYFAPPHHQEIGTFTPPLLAAYREELAAVRAQNKARHAGAATGHAAV